MTNSTNYYDIELDIEKMLNEDLNSIFYLKDLKQRKLFLESDVDQCTVSDIVKNILQYNKEDKDIPVGERQPVLLYVASNGGEVDAGFELIDAISVSKTPVYTINLGYQYSMGFLIGIAGHKRFAMPNAKFLMHDGSSFVYDSSSKVKDRIKFEEQVEARTKEFIMSRTKITSEVYDSKLRTEWYMLADEAKENGVIDFIIGRDCDVDEVV